MHMHGNVLLWQLYVHRLANYNARTILCDLIYHRLLTITELDSIEYQLSISSGILFDRGQ